MSYVHRKTNEEVQKEKYCWIAVYRDGSELHQFDDETGDFHQFAEIDQKNLHVFKMVGGGREFTLIFNPEYMELIHFYKRYRLDAGGPNDETFPWYVFGYKKKVGKHVEQVLMVITHTDELVVTDEIGNLRVGG